MYIVLVGCGRIGYHLTRALLAVGHEVLVIERDQQRYEALREELGSVVLHGDGTEVAVLKDGGISRADVVIAVTPRDEDNLAICQLAKQLARNSKTIALARDPQNEALFKLLDVGVTVNSTHLIMTTIEEEIPGHALVHLMNLRALQTELVSINIPPDAAVVGTPLTEIDLPPSSFISLVVKQQGPVLPSQEVVLEPGDDVVAVTSPEEEQILYETLTGVE